MEKFVYKQHHSMCQEEHLLHWLIFQLENFHKLVWCEIVQNKNDLIFMVIFESLLDPFVSGLVPVNVLSTFGMDAVHSWIFNRDFWLMNSEESIWIGTSFLS